MSAKTSNKVDNSSHAHKFNDEERELVIERIAYWDRQGLTQFKIRDKLLLEFGKTISQPVISDYLKDIWQGYSSMDLRSKKKALISQKFLQYQDLLDEAKAAWEESRKGAEKEVIVEVPLRKCGLCKGKGKIIKPLSRDKIDCPKCSGEGKVGGIIKTTRTKEGHAGDPRFLTLAGQYLEAVRELLGLDEDQKLSIRGAIATTNLSWDELFAQLPKDTPDLIEAEIAKAVTVIEPLPPDYDPSGKWLEPQPPLAENSGYNKGESQGKNSEPSTEEVLKELERRGFKVDKD